ncbi:MAG: MFS transporter [Desulfuromonadales bacterium]|nr:MFS transporter [Desulfuromonadales bacterium]
MKRLDANITKLYAFSFLQMTLFPMAIITLFWKDHIGLSLTQILLLQSILSIVMVVMEYPTGYISDRVGYRFALSLASLLGMTGWGVYTLASTFSHVLVAEILLGISLAFISGSDSALLYETLKAEGSEQDYARYQGRMSGFAQTGESLGAIFAGVMYVWAPLLPFILQVGVWLLALLLTRTMLEPPRLIASPASHLADALRSVRYAFVENRRLRSIILLNAALGLASFYQVWLIQPYMQHAGVPLAWFGPVWTGANLCVALGALASHRVTALMGDRRMLLLFVLLVWGGYLGLGTAGGVWGFLFYYLLTIMRGLRGPLMLGHAHHESPSSHRAGILSLQSFCFRLMFAISGPLVGLLADASGVRQTFRYLLVGFLVLLPPLAFVYVRHLRKTED